MDFPEDEEDVLVKVVLKNIPTFYDKRVKRIFEVTIVLNIKKVLVLKNLKDLEGNEI